jgi:hypothetical protein
MTRKTATVAWAALLVIPLAFMAVASTVAGRFVAPRLVEPVFWLALAASALNVVLSRALPPRLGPERACDRDAVAFTRVLVGIALCEAAAMAPIVAYMISRDRRLLGVLALDLLALVLLRPSDAQWARLSPAPAAREEEDPEDRGMVG